MLPKILIKFFPKFNMPAPNPHHFMIHPSSTSISHDGKVSLIDAVDDKISLYARNEKGGSVNVNSLKTGFYDLSYQLGYVINEPIQYSKIHVPYIRPLYSEIIYQKIKLLFIKYLY